MSRRRRSLPIGPPASASGPTWPMHAPVDTPEKRASVTIATCLAPRDELQRRRELVGLLHAGAERPRADQHDDVVGLDRRHVPPCPLIAAMASRLGRRTRAPARGGGRRRRRRRPTDRSPSPSPPIPRARGCPTGTPPCWSRPAARAASALMITRVGIDAVRLPAAARAPRAAGRSAPTSRAPRRASRPSPSSTSRVQQAHPAQVQHHLGHAARHEHLHGRMIARPVRQRVDQPRRRPVDADPVVDRRAPQPRRVRDRRDVQQQVRRPAERRVHAASRSPARPASGSPTAASAPRAGARSARAERRAMSSQTGSPDGASALCGSASPNASATTCDVAAVPRNWQPPPGVPHARQPMSAASSRLIRPCAKRAPMLCTLPASSAPTAGSVTPPGTMMPGRSREPASASIVAGSPLSQVAMPITPDAAAASGSAAASTIAASLRYGRLSNMPGRALRAAVARIAAVRRRTGRRPRRAASRAASRTSRPISQWPV